MSPLRFCGAAALLCAAQAFAQSTAAPAPTQPAQTQPAMPTWLVGGGASFFGPGIAGGADIDYHLGTAYYAHVAFGNAVIKQGKLLATYGAGTEARTTLPSYQNLGIGGAVVAGISTGNVTLSTFSGSGYVWWDVCQVLQKKSHCYLEIGGSVAGGGTSTASGSSIQLIPRISFRIGG